VKIRMSWPQFFSPEFFVEMMIYAGIIYGVYWAIKKGVWALRKRELTSREKEFLAAIEVLIYAVIFALRSR
jgi:hypothetical protein